MKKLLMKFLFTFVAVVGLSLSISAQKGNDDKKPKPPKETPTIDPGKKPPPRDDKKPKKPGMAFMLVVEGTEPNSTEGQ